MCKRILIFIIAAICLLIACTSCGRSDCGSESVPSGTGPAQSNHEPGSAADVSDGRFYVVDSAGAYANFWSQPIVHTDDCYYYVCDAELPDGGSVSMVYFSDAAQKDWLPLCSKPNCMHNTENCSAWMEGSSGMKLQLYGDRIYYIVSADSPELWRMKLDGSDHEKLLELQLPEDDEICGMLWQWYFHNKYVIVSLQMAKLNGNDEIRLYCVDLSSDTPEQKEFLPKNENGEAAGIFFPYLGIGDLLYTVNESDNSVNVINIAEQTNKKLCVLPFLPEYCGCAYESGLLYFADRESSSAIVSVDSNTGELRTVCQAEPKTHRWYFAYNGYYFGFYMAKDGGERGVEICDLNGNVVQELPYGNYNRDIRITQVLGDYVFGTDITGGAFDKLYSTHPEWYLDIRDIGTDNLMWRRWEPEG